MFARGEQVEDGAPGPVHAANHFDGDVDLRVVERTPEVRRDQFARDAGRTGLVRVAHHDVPQRQRAPGAGRHALRVFQE